MLELHESCIRLQLEATDKEEVLQELAALVSHRCEQVDHEQLHRILLEREHVGSTGVGNGIAIPHGKVPGLEEILLGFGRSRKGIFFDAVDNRPVHIFVPILSPVNMAGEYLRALARISRLLKDSTTRSRLLQAADSRDVQEIFRTATD
ncbi:MAG TPA: PTS sugar transporter subunit IIA [Desulfobulbus sp.]|nr:PTS sugar transporter subunit IIA [Desulfobulbus sp.]